MKRGRSVIKWENMKEWVSSIENEAEKFFKSHKEFVFIYGAGVASQWYLKFLLSRNVSVEGFIVSDIDTVDVNSVPDGLRLFSLDDVCNSYEEYSIIIGAPKFKAEIMDVLSDKCPNVDAYSFEGEIYYTFIHDIEEYRRFLLDNWDRINNLYRYLADELSRDTLQAFIMGRMSGNQDYFINSMVPNQYYPKDIMHFSSNEVMVECGSNDGKTMLEFVQRVNYKYKYMYLFEPDSDCARIVRQVINDNSLDKVDLIKKGAWEEKTTLHFAGDDSFGSGHITNDGEQTIETTTIDDVVKMSPTFIKMDIEGSELNALRGGVESIRRTPKLAICVYHKKEDFLSIPEFIKSINPNYRLYMRHHNWGATETVLYAVPYEEIL